MELLASGFPSSGTQGVHTSGRGPHLDLGIAALSTRLTAHRLATTQDPARRAALHFAHAVRLTNAGQHQDALQASQQAIDLYGELAELNRDAYLPDLAMSLNNHANRLAAVGRRAEAVPVSQQAVDLYGELAELNRDAYLPDLATSLNNHAALLAEVGQRAEAVPVSQQAVDLYGELAELSRDAYLPGYVRSLAVRGLALLRAGRAGEAVTPLVEGLVVGQELPEYARGIISAVAGVLRDAYRASPREAGEAFEALTGQPLPDWIGE